jgi:autotransporter-associated beta strand protein
MGARRSRALPSAALFVIGFLVASGFVTSAFVASANAQTTWVDATGSWFVSGNWSAGVPTGATPLTTVGNGGTAQIAGAAASAGTSLVINGASTVDLQASGSLTAGSITLGPTGTLLLSGSTAVAGDLNLGGGTLRSTVTGTLTDSIAFATGATSTIAAAAGQTLTLGGPNFRLGNPNAHAIFGSGTDTGTVVLAPTSPISANSSSNIEVAGGTLRFGNLLGASVGQFLGSVTVDAGATLDYNGLFGTLKSLFGTGTVQITGNTLDLLNGTSNFAGTIAGTGGALSLSNASVVLTGTNTYTGGTTIDSASTLQLGNGGTGGSILGNVVDNGTFIIDRSNTYTFGGVISGTGAFVQAGSGTTILTGISTYTGTTTVNAGTLEVDGSIANSLSVTVNSGGTLSGTGIVDPATTTIMGGGTLAPGNAANPTGTLTITGNLAFQAGALYLVQLGPSAASNVNVGGTATLTGANVQVGGSPGKNSYDILHAAGGLGGTTFNTLVFSNPNFTGSLSYTPTDVFLNLTGTLGAGTNLNQNQQGVANALNNFFNSGGTLPAGFANLFGLTGSSLANALTQLDGEAATGAERSAFQLTNAFLNLMLDPFVNGRANVGGVGMSAIGFAPEQEDNLPPDVALAYASILNKAPVLRPFEQRWSVWGTGFGGSNRANGDPTVGSSNVSASIFGFAGGVDYHVSPTTVVGFALAGAGTNWGWPIRSAPAAATPSRPALTALAGSARPMWPARSPSPITGSRPTAPRSATSSVRISRARPMARGWRAAIGSACCRCSASRRMAPCSSRTSTRRPTARATRPAAGSGSATMPRTQPTCAPSSARASMRRRCSTAGRWCSMAAPPGRTTSSTIRRWAQSSRRFPVAASR